MRVRFIRRLQDPTPALGTSRWRRSWGSTLKVSLRLAPRPSAQRSNSDPRTSASAPEARAGSILEREHTATAFDDVDRQLRVLPVFELRGAYVERRSTNLAEQDVAIADDEIVLRITHRRRSIATSAGLVKQQRTMLRAQAFDQFDRLRGCRDLQHFGAHGFRAGKSWRKNKSVRPERSARGAKSKGTPIRVPAFRLRGACAPLRSTRTVRGLNPNLLHPFATSHSYCVVCSEEPKRLRRVADQHVLRLLVSDRASSCASRGRCRTACSRRTPRAPDRRDSSSSTRAPARISRPKR